MTVVGWKMFIEGITRNRSDLDGEELAKTVEMDSMIDADYYGDQCFEMFKEAIKKVKNLSITKFLIVKSIKKEAKNGSLIKKII